VAVFSRKKKPKVKDSLSTSRQYFWGGSTAGPIVTETNALQLSAVYACVRVISEAVASLPVHVYRMEQDGAHIVPDHRLNKLLHNAPNPEMSSFVLRETMMHHLLIYGNAYVHISRDNGGRVTALYPLLPNKMDVNRSPGGEIYYTYWRDADETRPREKSGGLVLDRDDVMHVPGLSFDGLVGYSPIALAKDTIGLAQAANDYGALFFANNANPGGILEHPETLEDHDKIRESWESLYGQNGGHRLAVLEEGMKFHTVSIPPEQAQFLETRKFQLDEIARIFRVPPHMVGDLDKSSFSNIEQQSLEFVKYTVNPWVVRLEQAMSQALLLPSEQDSHFIKFNLDGLLRGDYETRMKGYAIGIQNGFLSPNDCRRLENMTCIDSPAGSGYFFNGNMCPIELAGIQWLGKDVLKQDAQE
jgi:HK97 family phage portal protein